MVLADQVSWLPIDLRQRPTSLVMVLLLSAVESRLASIALVLAVWALSALQLVVPHRVVVQSKPLVLSLVDVL